MSPPAPSVFTWLGRSRAERGARSARGARVLGAGAAAFAALIVSGCLVDSPPDFQEQKPSAPRIYDQFSVPNPQFPVRVDRVSASTLSITVRVESENLTDSLLAIPFVNYGLPSELTPLGTQTLSTTNAGGPFDATVLINLNDVPMTGCVPLTIVFQYQANVDFDNHLKPLRGKEMLASYRTWLLLLDKDPTEVRFSDCPQPATPNPTDLTSGT